MFNDTNDTNDTNDAKKARGNLILISSAVLLYVYGGGRFGTEVEGGGSIGIFGGTIHFRNKWGQISGVRAQLFLILEKSVL